MDDAEQDPDLRAGFTLGPWTVLPNQNRIENEPDALHLEPKVMEVLCALARKQGEVVSRNELIDEIWAGTYVTDEVLSRAISVLRSQLGDDRKNPQYVVTVPKVGYRLIMPAIPVPRSGSTAGASLETAGRTREWTFLTPILALLVLLVLGGYLLRSQPPDTPTDARSPTLFQDLSEWFEIIIRGDTAADAMTEIAVLPFDNLSEEPGNAFLSDGLTDELIYSLGQLEGLKVVARSSSLSYRNRHEDVRSIGNILKVQGVVEGTVMRSGDRIKIGVQLSGTREGYVLWSQTFERNLSDLLSLQEEISNDILLALQEKLSLPTQPAKPAPVQAPGMAAYQLYLNGRFLGKLRGESPLRKSIELYEQALSLDPDFTRARLALANSLVLLPYYSTEDEESAFQRALDSIASLGEPGTAEAGAAEAIRGFIALRRWQWQLAEEHFQSALLLAPNDPNIYVWYSQLLSAVGRNLDALKAAQQARDLDAVSPVVINRLATVYLWTGDNVRAAEAFARGAELGFANLRSAAYLIFLLRMGRFDEARELVGLFHEHVGVRDTWLVDNIEAIVREREDSGLGEDAERVIAAGGIYPRFQPGLWLYLDRPDKVVEVINQLASEKKYIDVELLFSEEGRRFRASDEFDDLTETLALVDYWQSEREPDPGLYLSGL